MQQVSSPNCGPRRDGLTPSIVVIHYTAMQSAEAAIERLCDPSAEVSAHYVIARTGEITQLVPEAQRAWHAGAGEWRDQTDINSRSIGIELDNAGTHPFPEPQMAALETLLAGILKRWAIRPGDVIGHSDMAPGRKGDPGPRFDWTRLAKAQLAAPTRMSPAGDPDTAAFRAIVNAAGFTAAVDDQSLLEAFRLRHRPSASGPLDAQDMKIAAGSASARAT
ncbi:N-acetylmuramoyl-L-alanine amidase [uncultured Roseobacter sp.]|uniref:N-acetylmuramoyl-L-alanine amidase n=1 Tax=uncultured Roseobacter sp. TaxID=114847 RepID=UPI00261B9DFB|nr:N-acetylmuramoyl-L-alanine amidase [uncultured Roseobacter sp.]